MKRTKKKLTTASMKKPPKNLKLSGALIDPNQLKTRDYLLVEIIKGATKAGVQKDRRKEANRTESRKFRLRKEEE